MLGRRLLVAAVIGLAMSLTGTVAPVGATHGTDVEVTNASPDSTFAQNKQNEPAVAIDPTNPSVMVAGANEEIDLEACAAGNPTTCPFTEGVGVTGVYFSFDGGDTWTQPVYSGWTARHCLGPAPCEPTVGPIGTLPRYFESGLVADGDPAMVFGPRPGADGTFSWSNGSRLYFSSLASNFSAERDEEAIRGFEAITVSRTDDVAAAAAGSDAAWMPPVVATKQNEALFSDKEFIWADNAESSPFFGNVYVCNAAFRSVRGPAEPIVVSRSTDGGDTWRTRQITQASNAVDEGRAGGRQSCTLRTDSEGVLYVFWRGSFMRDQVIWMARSFDGGVRFERPRVVAETGPVGRFDPVQRRRTFDGVAGARTNTAPSVDIANGAPTGAGSGARHDLIVLAYPSGLEGLNREHAMVQVSTDGGETWSAPTEAEEAGDRPDFPAVAVSPDGQDVYLVYMGFLDPWRPTTADPRRMQGVVRHADVGAGGALGAFATLLRGPVGDARSSSANSLGFEFLGDYNYAAATNDRGVAVWNDVRQGAVCPAIDAYRQSLVDGSPIPRPAPNTDCPPTFGNSDIWGASFTDPT